MVDGLDVVVLTVVVVLVVVGLIFWTGFGVTGVVGFDRTEEEVEGLVPVDEILSVVVAMVAWSLTDVTNGFVVVDDVLLKLELVGGLLTVVGLFPGEVGAFVVTVGRLVLLLVAGFLVLLMGLLVVDWVKGFAVVVFLGGNLVAGTILWVFVGTVFGVADSVVRSVLDSKGLGVVVSTGLCTVE